MERNDDIEKFLEGRSSPEEIDSLRKRVEEDEEFAKMVSSEVELKHGIAYAKRMEIIKKLEKIDQAKAPKEAKSFSFLKIAASIAVFLVAGFSIWYFTSGPKTNEVFLAYYEPITNIEIPPSRGSVDNELLDNARRAYLNGDFRNVEEYISQVSSEPVYRAFGNFILGVAQIELREYEEAIESFTKATATTTPILDASKWYRALCYIQLGETSKAIEDLNELKESQYADKVNEILKKLED